MATNKKNPTTTKPAEKNGVEKIIDYINANKGHIGAIVVCVAPNGGKKIPCADGSGLCDQAVFAADLVGASDAEQMSAGMIRSPITSGLAVIIKSKLIDRTGVLFG